MTAEDAADLAGFLEARLAEDEAAAKAATEGPRDASAVTPSWAGFKDNPLAPAELAAHIARHDPARALREVAAKRAILDAYVSADGNSPRDRDRGRWDALHAAVRNLAAAWSDHPDYRDAWKPA